jgi:hypothetical protein
MLRVGLLLAPLALASSLWSAADWASVRHLLTAWLALYLLVVAVWWTISQGHRRI